ncbi:MAG: hypothetical protein RLZZ172_1351 [Bacteroidota bacterium]|jgi:hypothetical protein
MEKIIGLPVQNSALALQDLDVELGHLHKCCCYFSKVFYCSQISFNLLSAFG